MNGRLRLIAVVLCLLFVGCAVDVPLDAEKVETPSASVCAVEMEAAFTPLPTATPIPLPTATPTPSPTPTPEPTATPVPTRDPNAPMVALTFDDGPTEDITPLILDLVEEYGVRVTFFMQGNRLYEKDEIVQRAVSLGCEIGTHGWSHADMTTFSKSELTDRLERCEDRISDMIDGGYDVRLMRPPYGSTDSDVYSAAVRADMAVIKWSVDTLDWESRSKNAVLDICKDEIRHGDIVLFHDKFESTRAAVEELIPWLLGQGYELVTVSELIESSGEELRAGGLYRTMWGKERQD